MRRGCGAAGCPGVRVPGEENTGSMVRPPLFEPMRLEHVREVREGRPGTCSMGMCCMSPTQYTNMQLLTTCFPWCPSLVSTLDQPTFAGWDASQTVVHPAWVWHGLAPLAAFHTRWQQRGAALRKSSSAPELDLLKCPRHFATVAQSRKPICFLVEGASNVLWYQANYPSFASL
jgi:hypothetical protein